MACKSVFYYASGSGPCIRAMIAIYEKKISDKLNFELVSFDKGETRSEKILRLNKRGQVPTMRLDGVVINESSAICDFVEMQYKNQGTKLIPDDKMKCARVLQRKAEAEANITFRTLEILEYDYVASEVDRQKKLFKDEFAQRLERIRSELGIWNNYLGGENRYAAVDEFSMADVQLMTALIGLVRFGLDISKYQKLEAYYNRCKDRESIQKSWPPHWHQMENPRPILKVI